MSVLYTACSDVLVIERWISCVYYISENDGVVPHGWVGSSTRHSQGFSRLCAPVCLPTQHLDRCAAMYPRRGLS